MPAHEDFMRLALAEAHRGLHLSEVPIGAVLVGGGEVLASGFNHPIHACDPTAHAEIVAPCLMCVGALLNARVATIVYGAREPKWGALGSVLDIAAVPANHRFEVVGGVLEAECRQVLVDFFKFRRGGG
jgi:tRNA(adenine34) deaminase